VGRNSDAEPLYQIEFAPHDGAGHAGLDRGAHDRRGTSRTNSGEPKSVFDFLKRPDFSVAAFKGQPLTLRDWNLQLRQPILLVDGRMVRVGFAAGGVPASILGTRYARRRSTRNQMQAALKQPA